MTDDWVAWLTAQLDADEQVAREADPEPSAEDLEFGDNPSVWADPYGEFQGRGGRVFAHVLRHDPARVLRRVASMRRTLELHNRDHECSVFMTSGEVFNSAWIMKDEMCSTVRLLFDEYNDRPGYREEWRP